MQDVKYDYGYDGLISTFDENGEAENGEIYVQLKCTDHIRYSENCQAFIFDLSIRDLELWLFNAQPVLLVLYNAQAEDAFYVNLQDYFRENSISLQNGNRFVRVFIPAGNRFNTDAALYQGRLKNAIP